VDPKDVTRKLSAILSADVQGYSRLMGDDEIATVETITEYRKTITSLVTQWKGRVVDSPGDNILAEFGSVVDAVQCAVEIQNILKAKNEDLSENRRMIFRIGVNLGDVIQEGDRIYGDGVNIAARIESLADGGGICISGTAYDQIKNKLALGYNYFGEHSVKNISEPVRVYKVPMDPRDVGKKRVGKSWKKIAITAAVLLILAGAAAAIWNFYPRPVPTPTEVASKKTSSPESPEKPVPLPDKPSIAVLPFDNMSGDPKEDYFCDGITENIITSLSKIEDMFVIARNSTFAYKGKPVNVKQIARELGVRYVLEGSIQRSKDRLRINAQLIDAETGNHLWAERYDRTLKDIFAIQDEITIKVLEGLRLKIASGDRARYWKGTENLEAYLKVLKALELIQHFNKEDTAIARQLCHEAIALDPNYSKPYSILSCSYLSDCDFGWTKSCAEAYKRAENLGQKAVSLDLDDTDTWAHLCLSMLYRRTNQCDKSISEAAKGVAISPNGADPNMIYARALSRCGRHEEAIDRMKKAIHLNPIPPVWYPSASAMIFFSAARYEESISKWKEAIRVFPKRPFFCFKILGDTYWRTGQYKEAIAAYKKALHIKPDYLPAHLGLAISYSLADNEAEARTEVAEVFRIDPKYSLEVVQKESMVNLKTAMSHNEADKQRVIKALRKAGFPEKPPLPLPDKPSIAVLPFANISGDPKEDYLSDGITEQIITALSKTPKLFVIARNSVFTYKGKPVMVQQVSKELGVRYVVEGSVQKSGDRIRITAQLIDAKTGDHLWAEKFDRDLKDIFALQDDIAINVITALQLKLTEGEQTRIYRRRTNNIEAYLNFLKGREHVHRHSKQDFLVAKRLLKEAIALDPNYTEPYQFLGHIHLMEVFAGWSPSPGESLNQAFELSQKILELDSSNAPVHGLLSEFYLTKKQHGKSISEAEKFIALDPNNADAYAMMGYALYGAGKFKDSISQFDKAIALNPIPPTWYLNALGWANIFAGLYDEANAVFRKLLIFYPKYGNAYYGLGCTLIAVGKPEEAVGDFNKALNLKVWSKSRLIGSRAIALVGIGKPGEAITTMQDLVSRRPDDADGYRVFSVVLGFEGRYEEALQMAKKAVSLQHGRLESMCLGVLGMSYFMLEQYDQAIAELKKSINLWPDYWFAHVWLAAAYSLTNRMEDARAEVAEVLRINPKTSLEGIAKNGYFNFKRADKERFINALRKAGLK